MDAAPPNGASLLQWVKDWGTWFVAGAGAFLSAVALLWKQSTDSVRSDSAHMAEAKLGASLAIRLDAIETSVHANALRITSMDVMLTEIERTTSDIRLMLA